MSTRQLRNMNGLMQETVFFTKFITMFIWRERYYRRHTDKVITYGAVQNKKRVGNKLSSS